MKKCIAIFFLFFCISQNVLADEELNVYIWPEYVSEAMCQKFTKETGIKVNISTYDSNESLYAKLKLLNSSTSYDIIISLHLLYW